MALNSNGKSLNVLRSGCLYIEPGHVVVLGDSLLFAIKENDNQIMVSTLDIGYKKGKHRLYSATELRGTGIAIPTKSNNRFALSVYYDDTDFSTRLITASTDGIITSTKF